MASSSLIIVDTIQVMLRQEVEYRSRVVPQSSSCYHDRTIVKGTQQRVDADNDSVRTAMVDWCCRVVTYCKLQLEIVDIAMNLADRMCIVDPTLLSSSSSTGQLYQYQCIVMTSLYIAAKIHSPEALDPELVSNLSRNLYSPQQIEQQERIILTTVQYRVNPITAHAYIHQLFALLHAATSSSSLLSMKETDVATKFALQQIDAYVWKYHCSTLIRPSVVAYCAFMNAIGYISLLRDDSNFVHNNNNYHPDMLFVLNFGYYLAQILNIDVIGEEMLLSKTQSILGNGIDGSISTVTPIVRHKHVPTTTRTATTSCHQQQQLLSKSSTLRQQTNQNKRSRIQEDDNDTKGNNNKNNKYDSTMNVKILDHLTKQQRSPIHTIMS